MSRTTSKSAANSGEKRPRRVLVQTAALFGKGRWFKAGGPGLVIACLLFASTPWLIGPSCPDRLVIATGGTDGAYYAFAQKYREILARDGISLEVRSTAGSVENCRFLAGSGDDVRVAIVQGGVHLPEAEDELQSLASLYLEPVWVFHRGSQPIDRLTELEGKRIAVGPEGSGTRAIALMLLRENELLPTDSSSGQQADSRHVAAEIVARGGADAARALKQGAVDAAFFVISPQSPIVADLLQSPDIHLMSFRRAQAYRRKFPYLSSVTLSEGLLDLRKNVPPRDIVLLAPAANLVAQSDLHAALVPLLLKAVNEVHADAGLLQEAGMFPSLQYVDYPANAAARRYFKAGPSLLYRHLPFGVAAWIDQVKLILLPLCTLFLPLIKAAPPLYRWRIRSKIYRWYRVLRAVDQKLKCADDTVDFTDDVARLRTLERELAEVSVPLSYMEEFYNLRLHVAYVISRLDRPASTSDKRLAKAA